MGSRRLNPSVICLKDEVIGNVRKKYRRIFEPHPEADLLGEGVIGDSLPEYPQQSVSPGLGRQELRNS